MLPAAIRASLALGLTGASLLVTLLGFFAPWWAVDVGVFGQRVDLFSAGPFSSTVDLTVPGEEAPQTFGGVGDQALDGETNLAGFLLLLALLGLAAAAALFILRYYRPALPAWAPDAALGSAALVGLVVFALAPGTWPGAFEEDAREEAASTGFTLPAEFEPSWSGENRVVIGEDEDGNPQEGRLYYNPGLGWYLSVGGAVLLPAGAIATRFIPTRRPQPAPRTTQLPPSGPPPKLPEVGPAKTGPPPAVVPPKSPTRAPPRPPGRP